MIGKLNPAQGGVPTGDVFGVHVSQGLQADHAGNTNAGKSLSRCLLICALDALECIAYIEPSRNTTESESFLLFWICICQMNGMGRIKTATSVAKFTEASMM